MSQVCDEYVHSDKVHSDASWGSCYVEVDLANMLIMGWNRLHLCFSPGHILRYPHFMKQHKDLHQRPPKDKTTCYPHQTAFTLQTSFSAIVTLFVIKL